jgi:hypothetical protein
MAHFALSIHHCLAVWHLYIKRESLGSHQPVQSLDIVFLSQARHFKSVVYVSILEYGVYRISGNWCNSCFNIVPNRLCFNNTILFHVVHIAILFHVVHVSILHHVVMLQYCSMSSCFNIAPCRHASIIVPCRSCFNIFQCRLCFNIVPSRSCFNIVLCRSYCNIVPCRSYFNIVPVVMLQLLFHLVHVSISLDKSILNILFFIYVSTVCDEVCQWLVTGRWFSLGTPVSIYLNKCILNIVFLSMHSVYF